MNVGNEIYDALKDRLMNPGYREYKDSDRIFDDLVIEEGMSRLAAGGDFTLPERVLINKAIQRRENNALV